MLWLALVTERSAHSRICSLFLLQNNRQLWLLDVSANRAYSARSDLSRSAKARLNRATRARLTLITFFSYSLTFYLLLHYILLHVFLLSLYLYLLLYFVARFTLLGTLEIVVI
jgi:hypothetical protein